MLLAAVWALAGASVVWAAGAVGEVTLVIGQSQIERGSVIREARKGDAVLAGDRVRTAENGHLHIRFIDDGRVSIRPNSLFSVAEFSYDAARPAASTIRLNLESGEARTISGIGARSARERFRLNTPLVAIGVKGTDFITRAQSETTIVTVNEGAIVMAPFDLQCTAGGLGACSGPRARELTEAMGGMALVYRPGGSAEDVIQVVPVQKDSQKIQLLDRMNRGDERLDAALVNSKVEAGLDQVVAPNRLIWGRWGSQAVPGDTLTRPFLEAMVGNEVTVGDGYYFLFREKGVPNQVADRVDRVSFKLGGSAASYREPGRAPLAAAVTAGSLDIDFGQRTYDTALVITGVPSGTQNFRMGGTVDTLKGLFLGKNAQGARLAGALALDGRQAGYFFSQPAGVGVVTGATLWGR